MNPNAYPPYTVSASELRDAVEGGFLTQEEARTVYWAQCPVLRDNAASTPPPIPAKA